MSFNADAVIVPYAVFAERRERRNRAASSLEEPQAPDVSLQRPPTAPALEPVADALVTLERQPATGEKGDGS